MKDKTRQEAVDRILLAMCNYYQQALTQDVLTLYHLLWADQEVRDISAACTIWMKQNRWYPKADEIIKIIEEQKGPVIDIKHRALEQWRVVLQQLRHHGAYHPPSFSDPITAHLIRNQFRWSYLSEMKQSEEQWEQKRWIEAFEVAARVHQDLLQIDVPKQVMELIENVTRKISEPAKSSEPVPVEKIKAFRKMLEGQATEDEKELELTNKRINVQKGEI
jgi:hypothetical protein